MGYARRQQFRRLIHALGAALGAGVAALLAVVVAGAGSMLAALVLLLFALVLGFRARHWAHLAGRSRVGAGSEDEVRRVLAPLGSEGWRLRHSLAWLGRGDIDSLAISPSGAAFVIEIKTSRYEDRHLALVRKQAAWLGRFRRRWCRGRVMPVLCVVRRRGIERWDAGVLVVSIDRLVPALHQ